MAAFLGLWVLLHAATAGQIAALYQATDELALFDTVARTLTTVGPLGVDLTEASLVYDPVAEALFAFDHDTGDVYAVDLSNGAATPLFSIGPGYLAATWDPVDQTMVAAARYPNGLAGWYGVGPTGVVTTLPIVLSDIPFSADWSSRENAFVFTDGTTDRRFSADPRTHTHAFMGGGGVPEPGTATSYDIDTDQYWSFDLTGVLTIEDPDRRRQQVAHGLPAIRATAAIAPAVSPIRLDQAGDCVIPPKTIWVRNATAGGSVAFVLGRAGGSFTLPSGPCAGATLPIGAPRVLGTSAADATGGVVLHPRLPRNLCYYDLVAVDLSTCMPSNAAWM